MGEIDNRKPATPEQIERMKAEGKRIYGNAELRI